MSADRRRAAVESFLAEHAATVMHHQSLDTDIKTLVTGQTRIAVPDRADAERRMAELDPVADRRDWRAARDDRYDAAEFETMLSALDGHPLLGPDRHNVAAFVTGHVALYGPDTVRSLADALLDADAGEVTHVTGPVATTGDVARWRAALVAARYALADIDRAAFLAEPGTELADALLALADDDEVELPAHVEDTIERLRPALDEVARLESERPA